MRVQAALVAALTAPTVDGGPSRPSTVAGTPSPAGSSGGPWLSRIPTSAQQQGAQAHSLFVVHLQELNGGAPGGSQPGDDTIRGEREALSPRGAPGMMKRYDSTRLGINRRNVGALLQVATDAAQAQVGSLIRSTMLLSDDMVDLMGQNRRCLWKLAILACTSSTPLDQLARVARKLHDAARMVQKSSASSLRTLSISFKRTTSAYSLSSSGVSVPSVLLRASSSTRGARSRLTASSAASSCSRVCFSMVCFVA